MPGRVLTIDCMNEMGGLIDRHSGVRKAQESHRRGRALVLLLTAHHPVSRAMPRYLGRHKQACSRGPRAACSHSGRVSRGGGCKTWDVGEIARRKWETFWKGLWLPVFSTRALSVSKVLAAPAMSMGQGQMAALACWRSAKVGAGGYGRQIATLRAYAAPEACQHRSRPVGRWQREGPPL